jgi:hypothetical protein
LTFEPAAPEFSVRVLAREPQRLAKELREQVEVIRGSTDDPAALRPRLDGVESLFWCVPAESLQETKVEMFSEMARVITDAERGLAEFTMPISLADWVENRHQSEQDGASKRALQNQKS